MLATITFEPAVVTAVLTQTHDFVICNVPVVYDMPVLSIATSTSACNKVYGTHFFKRIGFVQLVSFI